MRQDAGLSWFFYSCGGFCCVSCRPSHEFYVCRQNTILLLAFYADRAVKSSLSFIVENFNCWMLFWETAYSKGFLDRQVLLCYDIFWWGRFRSVNFDHRLDPSLWWVKPVKTAHNLLLKDHEKFVVHFQNLELLISSFHLWVPLHWLWLIEQFWLVPSKSFVFWVFKVFVCSWCWLFTEALV